MKYILGFYLTDKTIEYMLIKSGFRNNVKQCGIVTENVIDLNAKQSRNVYLTSFDDNDKIKDNASQLVTDYMDNFIHHPLLSNYNNIMLSSLELLKMTYGPIDSIILVFGNEAALSNKIDSDENQVNQQRLNKEGYGSKKGDMMRYKLWVNLNRNSEEDRKCIYTGEQITLAHAMDRDTTNIDHIIPYCVSKNNSMDNLLLCMKSANVEKGNNTPRQKWSSNENRWEKISMRCRVLPEPNAKRILCEDSNLKVIQKNNGETVNDIVTTPNIDHKKKIISELSRYCNDVTDVNADNNRAKEIAKQSKNRNYRKKAARKFNYKLLEALMNAV